MDKKQRVISALLVILLGLMLIVMRDSVVRALIAVLGVGVLVCAVMDFVYKMPEMGLIKAVVGVGILVFGWLFVRLALYILAVAVIAMGLIQILNIYRYAPAYLTGKEKFAFYLRPVLSVLAGACLLFNQGGTVAWVFIVTGVLLVVEGIAELYSVFTSSF